MKVFKLRLLLPVVLAITVVGAVAGASYLTPQAKASFGNPSNFVSFTLEGCDQDGTMTFPNANPSGDPAGFVCPDNRYGTGNQGKNWNELDLVPMRLTTDAGNQAGATTDYSVVIAADSLDAGGHLGYDVMTAPVINAAKSDASCSVGADPSANGPPITGGTAATIVRTLTIHQNKGTTCVLDWTQRLGIGSGDFSGSSLQSYLFQTSNFTGSKKTVPLPVDQTLPQVLSKTMGATQNTNTPWNLTKEATPNTIPFGNVCAPGFNNTANVGVTINWTKLAPVRAGQVLLVTNIYASNPSARPITTSVSDQIYAGAAGDNSTPLGTPFTASVVVPANTSNVLVGTHTLTVAASSAMQYHDVATGSYVDTASGITIPQTTSASASTGITTGSNTNSNATVTDTESLTGNALTFSVAAPSFGSFTNGYIAGAATVGPVDWSSGANAITGTGSITFSKTITLGSTVVTSGDLHDTATLNGSDGFGPISSTLHVGISSSALTTLTINKTIPNVLTGAETAVFTFHVKDASNTEVGSTSITFGAGETAKSANVNNLAPGTYTVSEDTATGWSTDTPKTADLTLPDHCSNSVTFSNSNPPASVSAHKVTEPNGGEGGWVFTLTKPDNSTVSGTTDANGNIASSVFGDLTQQGQYTITETSKPGFTQVNAVGCTFTVDFPADSGHAFSCTITNRQDATLTITKVTAPVDSGSDSFPFTTTGSGLSGFSLDTHTAGHETKTFTFSGAITNYGSKHVAEGTTTGWSLTNVGCGTATDSDATLAGVTVDIQPGDNVTCTYTNKQDAHLTIVKETSPVNSGADAFGFTSAALGPFTLDTNGNTATNPNHVTFDFTGSGYGSKSVTESTVPTGWALVSKSCVGANDTGSGATATVDIQPGSNVTCTYTNVKAASLTIIKDTNPVDSGAATFPYTGSGTGVSASFSLDTHTAGHETTTFTFLNGQFGPKTVTEGDTPGWSLTNVGCVGDEPNTGSGAQVAVNIQAGDNVTCTYHNVKDAKLTIVKVTDPANSGADSFPYTTSFGAPAFTLDTNTGNATNPISKEFVFHAGDFGSKSVTEGSTTGWTLTDITCSKGGGAGSTATVNIVAGDDVLCTFSNTKDATITVVKVTSPANSLADTFPYTVSGDGMGSGFSLDTNPASATSDSKLITLHGADATGTKTVIEGTTTGWSLFSLSCTGGGLDTSTSGSTSTIGLDPGENVVCTYTNRSRGTVRVVKALNGAPLVAGDQAFTFELRLGDQTNSVSAPLETLVTNSTNLGTLNFTTQLVPGQVYAICELVVPTYGPDFNGYGSYNPGGNQTGYVCLNFTITTTQAASTPSITFNINNTHQTVAGLTIGFWKTHAPASCKQGNGNQADALSPLIGNGIELGANYTETDACKLVQLLSKNSTDGKKQPGDIVFSMVAQLVAVELNINDGTSATCDNMAANLTSAQNLLTAVNFDGKTHAKLSATQQTTAANLNTAFDLYNNNNLPGC